MRAIIKLIKKLAYDTRVSHKLFLVIMGMVVIPVCCLGILFYSRFENVIKGEIGTSYEQIVNQYTDNINYKLKIYQNLLENIVMNGTVQRVLTRQDNDTSVDTLARVGPITSELDSLIYGINQNEIHSLKIYAYNDAPTLDRRYVSNLDTVKAEAWYDNLVNSSENGQYFFYTTEGLNRKIVSFTKAIPVINGKVFREKLGFVKLDIDMENLLGMKEMLVRVHCKSILIYDKAGSIITSGGQKAENTAEIWNMYVGNKAQSGNSLIGFKSQKQIVAFKSVDKYGWMVFFIFPYSEIEAKVKDAAYPVLIVSVALLIVLLGLTVAFSYFFSGRISRLTKKMSKVEEGNLEITETIQGTDEIGMVDIHFNRMVERLRGLISENYIQQLERREAELNALQTQINPHFLYNTFEAVNSIASFYGSVEICTITQNLGEMFRYAINIGRNEFVRLNDEIQHIRNYISIQMIRYNNCFEVIYLIPEEYYKCRMLKFILQPIVENAFMHGFKGNKKGGRIVISTARYGDRLELYIEDNGKGMNSEQLMKLEAYLKENNNSIITSEKRSIGIKNVNSRIKLAYGDDFGLSFQSSEAAGTKVTIVLPYVI